MNKKFSFLRFILLVAIVIITSCSKKGETPVVEASKIWEEPDMTKMTKITSLQKLMAQKAVKPANENNPFAIHKLTADPCVLVYKDTVYVYGTNDAQQAEVTLGMKPNGFERINTLNVYSSKDLVNWTDCGEIPVAGKNNPKGPAKWANNSWAPAIAYKTINGKDKFFLYFADNGSGIGVLTADSPTGPFTDPIGAQLVSRQTPNTDGVYWLFDPAVFVDDDGTGYLYYGGGVQDDIAHPKSARCVQLGEDMISIVGTPKEIDAPWLFEDSGINKINGKYVYSYCANWSDRTGATGEVPPTAVIAYMTSDNPLGPFKYAGYTLENPGTYYGPWGNNHHWMFKLNDDWYIAYHGQTTEKLVGFTGGGYRSLFVNKIEVNADGTLPIQKVSKAGCEKLCDFNAYDTVPAATFHSFANVAVSSKQTLVPIKNGAWILVKNVDLSKGVKSVKVSATEQSNGQLIFALDKPNKDNILATVEVSGTENTVEVNVPADTNARNIYIMFQGTVELVSWELK